MLLLLLFPEQPMYILMIKKAGGLIFDPTTVASKRGCPSFEVVP